MMSLCKIVIDEYKVDKKKSEIVLPLYCSFSREDGVLVVGPSAKLEGFAAKFQNDHAANLSEEPFERLSEGERVQRFPLFTSKFASIFYPKAGFIKANKALKAFQVRQQTILGKSKLQ